MNTAVLSLKVPFNDAIIIIWCWHQL